MLGNGLLLSVRTVQGFVRQFSLFSFIHSLVSAITAYATILQSIQALRSCPSHLPASDGWRPLHQRSCKRTAHNAGMHPCQRHRVLVHSFGISKSARWSMTSGTSCWACRKAGFLHPRARTRSARSMIWTAQHSPHSFNF